MKVTTYDVTFYADEVRSGHPYTFIRYGEGDLRLAVPSIPAKGLAGRRFKARKEHKELAYIWSREANQDLFREEMIALPRHERYWPALWHLPIMERCGWLDDVRSWLDEVGLGDVDWHDGRVWRRAVESVKMGIMMDAIRTQPLPIVVIAPERMEKIQKRLPVAKFVTSPMPCGPDDIPAMMEGVLEFDKPCLIIVCAAAAGKIVIHRLFPLIGEHSFIIDFGASLDGMCGNRVRGYHGPKALPKEAIERNWGAR